MLYQFSFFRPFDDKIIHGITTRPWGGHFREQNEQWKKSMQKLKDEWAIPEPVTACQVHGDQILALGERPPKKPSCDGLMTQTRGLPLMVRIADCQGVLMFDPVIGAIAAIHSGWRSSALNILGKSVKKMSESFGVKPTNLRVGISPSLGPCCARFSDPAKELPDFLNPYTHNNHVDFWTLSKDQLVSAGVPEKQIEIAGECTQCQRDRYFSHRGGDKERMGAFIMLI